MFILNILHLFIIVNGVRANVVKNMADNGEEETPSPPEKPRRPHRKARESTQSITHALKRTIRAKSHQVQMSYST